MPWEDIGGHIPAELTATGHNQSEAFLALTDQSEAFLIRTDKKRKLRLCPHMERMPRAVMGEDKARSQPRL